MSSSLFIDIGNSCLHWLHCGGELEDQQPSQQATHRISPHVAIQKLLSDMDKYQPTDVYIASVAEETLTQHIIQSLPNALVKYRIFSDAQFKTLRSGYQNPEMLGVDRWLALIHAYETFQNHDNILVVDIGSATTIDWLYKKQHQGGWILPGYLGLPDHLQQQCAQYSGKDSDICPKSTNSAISEGFIKMLVLTIEGLKAQCSHKSEAVLLFSGGGSELLKPFFERKGGVFHDNAVLKGMKIWQLSQQERKREKK